MKKITLALTALAFFFMAINAYAFPKESFVTVTIPVRGYENWRLKKQKPLDFPLFYYQQASQSGIPTSFMLRYDAIENENISSRLADLVATDSAQLLGGLLEVTPKLAQKANAKYQNHGSFTSANRLFLSGYKREDRIRIIDAYMESFFNRFGNYPPVVGVDSLDSFSFNYLVSRYSVIAAFVKDETYQNSNLRQWGGYLASPYLPSKTNILVPAQSAKNKINGVIFKWSPTDPLYVYQKKPSPRSIFEQLPDILNAYTLKTLNESTHFNIRLDNSYKLIFEKGNVIQKEFQAKQSIINLIKQLKDSQEKHTLRFMSAAELGETTKARYPETSSASFYKLGNIYWYQNPFYRLVLLEEGNKAKIIDFRVYNPKIAGNYFHQENTQAVAYQEVLGIVSAIKYPNNFLSLDLDLKKADIGSEYWDLILKDQEKVLKLEPNKIIFENLSPPRLKTKQVKVKNGKNSTQWLITQSLPFKEPVNIRSFILKITLVILSLFAVLKALIKRDPPASTPRKLESMLFLGLIFGFISLIPVIFSGQVYSFGFGLWGPNGHDAIFHLSVINSLKESLTSLSHPQLSGFFLKNYHLGTDWLIALISKITNISPVNILFRWFPIALVAVIIYQIIKLLSSWKFSNQAINLSLFLSFLAGSFGFLFTFLKSGNLFAGESIFWMNQSVSMFLNPPFAFSVALLLVFLNLYTAEKDHESSAAGSSADGGDKGWFANLPAGRQVFSVLQPSFLLLILIGGSLAQVKIYAFILLLLALAFLREIKLLIGIGLVGLLLSLPTLGLQGSPFVFSPLWFPKSLIAAQDKLNWGKLAQAWQAYEANGIFIKLFMVNSLALGIYLLGNLGVRVVGLLNILKGNRSLTKGSLEPQAVRSSSEGWGKISPRTASPFKWLHSYADSSEVGSVALVKLIVLLGLIIPLLFIQTNNPWNTIQFSYYSLFFLSFFTAKQLAVWSKKIRSKSLSFVFYFLLFALSLPTTIGTLKDYLTPYSASKISFTELQALEILKTAKKGVVISPLYQKRKANQIPEPKPLYAYTSTAYISALSGQPEYLSDLINLNITGFDYRERAKNTQRLFRTKDVGWVKEFLAKENIRYIYTTPIGKLNFDPSKAGLTPIFISGEITIYKSQSS